MADFISLVKVLALCATTFVLVFVVLLALPHSKLRSVCLEFAKYVLAAGLFLLIPSPIDVLPDVAPVIGWADDFGYLVGGIKAIRSARADRRRREFEQELDVAYRSKMAGYEAASRGQAASTQRGGSDEAA